jgi:hypothetical protein
MQAIERINTKIYIVDAGTNATDLAETDIFKGEITEFSQSGGSREKETTHTFGGDITRSLPRGEFELSLSITPSYGGEEEWVSQFFGEDPTNSGYYTSSQDPTDKAIFIEASDGTVTTTHAYNNLQAVTEEVTQPADEVRTFEITFNTSPQTQTGLPNYMWSNVEATSLVDWSALETA